METGADRVYNNLLSQLKQAMQKQELSQVAAAQLTGIDQPRLSKILAGQRGLISIERLAFDTLLKLGYTVEVKVRPSRKPKLTVNNL